MKSKNLIFALVFTNLIIAKKSKKLPLFGTVFPKKCTVQKGDLHHDVDDQIERGQNCWRTTLERGCLDDSLSDILENQYFVFNVMLLCNSTFYTHIRPKNN